MTIDEAIIFERKESKKYMPISASYHNQLAEWLEELKNLREYKREVEWVIKTQRMIKNDKIDEFTEKLVNNIDSFDFELPNNKNVYYDSPNGKQVAICTLDGVIDNILDIAEQMKDSKK